MKRAIIGIIIILFGFTILGCPNPVSDIKNSNADLKTLSIDHGILSPAFSPDITEYTVNVLNSVSSVTISGSKSDDKANMSPQVTLNNLIVGVTQIASITVTAENGLIKIYNVEVTRNAALSSNANLSSLTINSGSLNPVFASGTFIYNVSIDNSVTEVTITGTKADTNATISNAVNLSNLLVGVSKTATITVTAQDGIHTNSYLITVTRAESVNLNISGTWQAYSVTTSSTNTGVFVIGGTTTSQLNIIDNTNNIVISNFSVSGSSYITWTTYSGSFAGNLFIGTIYGYYYNTYSQLVNVSIMFNVILNSSRTSGTGTFYQTLSIGSSTITCSGNSVLSKL